MARSPDHRGPPQSPLTHRESENPTPLGVQFFLIPLSLHASELNQHLVGLVPKEPSVLHRFFIKRIFWIEGADLLEEPKGLLELRHTARDSITRDGLL